MLVMVIWVQKKGPQPKKTLSSRAANMLSSRP